MASDAFTGVPSVTLPVHSSGWETVGSLQTLYRSDGRCIGSVLANQANRRTEVYADKHYSRVDIVSAGGVGCGPAVRVQANGDMYSIYADDSTTAYPFELIGGTGTDWDPSGITVAAGAKTVELRVNATTSTTIELWVNGALVKSYTGKSALSGGKPGLYAYGNPTMDNWVGDDVSGGSIALAGSTSATATAIGAPTTQIRAAGGALASSTAAASLSSSIALSGGASVVATPGGQLSLGTQISGAAIAQSILAAALSTLVAARGAAGALASGSGNVGTSILLAGGAGAQAAPAGVLITWGSVTLAWTAVVNAVGYRVKWGTAPGTYTSQTDIGNVLIYAVGGLTPGLTYYWTVVALHAGGDEGAAATEVSGTPDVPGSPLPLTGAIVAAAVATAAAATQIRTAGTAQAIAAVAGSLQGAGAALAGVSAGVVNAQAQLGTRIAASGQVLDVTTVAGALGAASAALQGLAAAQSGGQAELTVVISVSGAGLAQAAVAAGLTTIDALLGAAGAQAGAAGTLSGTPAALGGASLAQTLAAADVTTQIRLQAALIAQAIVGGGIEIGVSLAGIAGAIASGLGVVGSEIRIAGQSAALATPIATLSVASALLAAANGAGRRRQVTLPQRHREAA